MFTNFFDLEGTVQILHQSRNATGVPEDADSPPTYSVYSLPSETPIKTGTTSLFDSADTAGLYLASFTAAAADGFASGGTYTLYVLETVNGDVHSSTYVFRIL